ncbi:aspartate aminotransferase family protein [Mesorhizobium sp. M5C.F.Cr.IN.023.01.1.1]|uniref:aspartate aminotransferase family protein n=1 Tax=Mesorhizobium sp. M5C.F.Cr.IN.023.01.1.1 TaxID=2496768 RepID=UPI000FCB388D|nr:aspartate aminotransferase family protein [Mesorhizobium sp. M5C.F.Cr.IN.023.01.1.1]RUV77476.1 aspartate aminotransferase family protein [Mesorhizobium sp. M5C.F.Cr.IN.023.01.1.1]
MTSTNIDQHTSLTGRQFFRSAELFERAQRVITGGNARLAIFQRHHPIYFARGAGVHLFDIDGNRYLDFLNNFTALIHGHGCRPVLDRLRDQLELGVGFSGPTELEVELAELLCGRVPYFEQIRFMNSGTEAVMYTIKAARALTGRPKIAKIEGSFHGSYDSVEVSLDSTPANWGSQSAPRGIPYSTGMSESVVADTVVLPFNELRASREILEANKDRLAAVLIDVLPQRVGLVPIDPRYLAFLREFTARHGIVLISDEVMSFRLSYRGGITRFGFEADLCAFAKIIGGGLPIGAVGGPSRFMLPFDTTNGKALVPQAGTFSANPISMAAGIAAMQCLSEEDFQRLDDLAEYARSSLVEMFRQQHLPYSVTGMGSMFRIHRGPEAPKDYREAYAAPEQQEKMDTLIWALQKRGVIVSPTCQLCLSTPMSTDHIDEMVTSVREAAQMLETA